jgi:uncharacterized membrane protein
MVTVLCAVKWIPPVILGAAAAVLGLMWDSLPARWAVHWGLGGHPNGWATKTPAGVFGPLLLGAAILVAFYLLARMLERRAPEQTSSLYIIATALSLVFAGVAVWLPLVQPTSPTGFVLFTVVVIGVALVAAMIVSARAMKRMPVGTVPEGYHGLFYKNSKDERLWVPKRSGYGWTINFAHPAAWPTMLLLLSPAFLVIAVVLLEAVHK